MKKCLVLLTLAVIIAGYGHGVRAHADAEPTKVIALSPATSKPTIDPGQTVSDTFQVINQGSAAYSFRVYAAPYGVHGEDYTPDFSPIPNKPDVASWLHFDTTQASIKPNGMVNIRYSIRVPSGTAPGGYYAVAFVESKSDKENKGVIVNERVGEVFYIRVAGQVHESGRITKWSVPFLQSKPMKANLYLQNSGGVHYSSNVHVTVQDALGNTKYSTVADKEILPQTVRHLPFSWNTAPLVGLFKVTGSVHLPDGDTPLPNRYVLIMATPVRVVIIVVIAALVGLQIVKSVLGVSLKRRESTPPRKQAGTQRRSKRRGKEA